MSAAAGPRAAGRVAAGALALWGVVHVVGGSSLLAGDVAGGLEALGPGARSSVPDEPGEVVGALLRFHALNIVLGGVAVLVLTAVWSRTRRARPLEVALAVAAGLDVGLILFLVLPGTLPATQGLLGPILVVVGSAALVRDRASASRGRVVSAAGPPVPPPAPG